MSLSTVQNLHVVIDKQSLDHILHALSKIYTQGNTIMATLQDIQAAENAEANAATLAIVLIEAQKATIADLQAQLAAAQAAALDPVAAQAVVDQANATAAALTTATA